MTLAIFLLLATPATAQDIDRTRTDVKEFNGSTSCRFKALPQLTLETATGYWTGRWNAGPAGATAGTRTTLLLLFAPVHDENRNKTGARLGAGAFTVDRGQIGGKTVAASRLTLDDGGAPITDLIQSDQGDHLRLTLRRAAVARIEGARLATLTLLDAAGAPIATHAWDISSVRNAGPLLHAVEWRCQDPRL